MKVLKIVFLFSIVYYQGILLGQSFSPSPLINIPGDNYDFDTLSSGTAVPSQPTYICWVNENNSIYTVYFKEIAPVDGEIILVSSDSLKKTNPKISYNGFSKGLKISWQIYHDNFWKILYCTYQNDSLNTSTIIADSIQNDPQMSMNVNRICWIDGGKLLVKEFYPEIGEAVAVDSVGCSSPDLANEDGPQILYEKGPSGAKQIYLAKFNKYISDKWNLSVLSHGGNNIRPRFGLLDNIAFQSYQNGVWKAIYTKYGQEFMDTTRNRMFNYKNPIVFTYPIPTSSSNSETVFFLAFDSDSADMNVNNVYIQTFGYDTKDSVISISNVPGNNHNPDIAYLNYADSVQISIIWEREYNNKTDIWIAKDKFSPIWSNISEKKTKLTGFSLKQNYPNPFNPSTTIEYYVEKPGFVSLTIYNLRGEEIDKLVQEFKTEGRYKVKFDGHEHPSGIYFYELKTRGFKVTKSMLLLR